jgi:hypothetical protein
MRNYETIAKYYAFSLPFLLYVAKYSYVFGIFAVAFDMNNLALTTIPHCRSGQGSEYV